MKDLTTANQTMGGSRKEEVFNIENALGNIINKLEQTFAKVPETQTEAQVSEEVHDSEASSVDSTEEPVNILVLDGGGMRGYGGLAMLEALEEMYGNEQEIFQYFDLFAGASIGGMAALLRSRMVTLRDTVAEARDVSDDIRDVFPNSALRLILRGTAVKPDSQIFAVVKNRYGSDEALFLPGSPPAMSLCTMRKDVFDLSGGEHISYEPLVFRTYAYPDEINEGNNAEGKVTVEKEHFDDDGLSSFAAPFGVATSNRTATLCEAMAATSAVPGIVDRVEIEIDGKKRSVGDGFEICNAPIAIAIDEARKLYPKRPLGVVLSLGVGLDEEHHIIKAVEIARGIHPGMHFHRIVPSKIMSGISPVTTDLKEIALMEEKVRQFMYSNEVVQDDLKVTMEKLFASKNLERKSKILAPQDVPQSVVMTHYQCKEVNQERRFLARKLERYRISENFVQSMGFNAFTQSVRMAVDAEYILPKDQEEKSNSCCCFGSHPSQKFGSNVDDVSTVRYSTVVTAGDPIESLKMVREEDDGEPSGTINYERSP